MGNFFRLMTFALFHPLIALKKLQIRSIEREEIGRKLFFGVDYIYGADVKGEIAEFGTMTGWTASIIARSMHLLDLPHYSPKSIHLFDSFQGLPESESPVDQSSPHVKTGTWKAGTCKGITERQLYNKVRRFLPNERIHIYNGWFSNTLPTVAKGTTFAMLHIDCDLYQSTMDVLEYCFSKRLIAEGAAIFFDDFNCNRASPDFGERLAWKEIVAKYSVLYSDCGEYYWAGRKFIVHSYRQEGSPSTS